MDVPQSTAELLRLNRRLEDGRLNQNGTNQNKVKLLLEDGTAYSQEGTLQFRDVTVDPTTGSSILRIVFPNPEGVLLPGMFVRAVVKEGVHEQAILIPQQAVSRDLKGNPVALIVGPENKVQQRMLTLDRAIGDQWLVSSGLAPGDRVIVEGMQKVRPGAAVKIAAPAVAPPAAGTTVVRRRRPPLAPKRPNPRMPSRTDGDLSCYRDSFWSVRSSPGSSPSS